MGDCDAVRLLRVLDNLLSNATKYSPEGGPILVSVERAGSTGEPWAVIRVVDRGIGIPAADLPHVFEPFYRAVLSGKRCSPGWRIWRKPAD
jgi:signal transduction histidine kinase